MTTLTFTVKMRLPPTATVRDCEEYIRDAVRTWRGQCRPPGAHGSDDEGNPMWLLDPRTVTVRAVR